ncbi:hypothetical protein NLG97_g6942 [Lecanicillium saksenae]|uniref:Uncharacterized protein n=1 Tax=Lecanicillium saksenae TaxID=468837 RepID=A0ACC1QQK4_9HYPO|nr:hypothetical protein NLG97_g6942 [Lecanicillium saksenae]
MQLYSSHISGFLLTICALASGAAANTEKVIFKGPELVTYPLASPSLADLNLDVIDPGSLSIRTNLSRVFHDDSDPELQGKPRGHASWFLLDNLTPGQRYELRVCWAAIQPTEFTLSVHELNHVFETPDLMSSLHAYTSTRAPVDALFEPDAKERTASLLLLQVHAAADYFSHHRELMRSPPPPVLVDLILDPYRLNVVPESLLLTAVHVCVAAVVAYLTAKMTTDRMTAIGGADIGEGRGLLKKFE